MIACPDSYFCGGTSMGLSDEEYLRLTTDFAAKHEFEQSVRKFQEFINGCKRSIKHFKSLAAAIAYYSKFLVALRENYILLDLRPTLCTHTVLLWRPVSMPRVPKKGPRRFLRNRQHNGTATGSYS